MSDYKSGLPVRTEADGADERLQTKIVDKTNPGTQQMTVDTDSNAHVEVHGNKPSGADIELRLSELGAPNGDGIYDVSNNTKPAHAGLIASQRTASPADSDQIKRVTAVTNSTTHALDVSLHDAAGAAFSQSNPLPVTFSSDSGGTEIHDYLTSSAVAKDASVNHTYSVGAGQTLLLQQILCSASGKMKVEIQIGDGAPVEAFTTKFVRFNSTAKPEADVSLISALNVVGTATGRSVKVIRTNLDNQAQDLYSTIIGVVI